MRRQRQVSKEGFREFFIADNDKAAPNIALNRR